MSYRTIVDAVDKINSGITGIRATYRFEPVSVRVPCLYTLFGGATLSQEPARELADYTVLMRLLLSFTDPEKAEADLVTLVDRIRVRYQGATTLDGALTEGIARITSIRGAYLRIGKNTIYRMAEFNLEVLEAPSVTFKA